jgi:hypothetical protein
MQVFNVDLFLSGETSVAQLADQTSSNCHVRVKAGMDLNFGADSAASNGKASKTKAVFAVEGEAAMCVDYDLANNGANNGRDFQLLLDVVASPLLLIKKEEQEYFRMSFNDKAISFNSEVRLTSLKGTLSCCCCCRWIGLKQGHSVCCMGHIAVAMHSQVGH